jgi:hypothetical protein
MEVLYAINAVAFVVFSYKTLSDLSVVEAQFKLFVIADIALYAIYFLYVFLMNKTLTSGNMKFW